MIVVGHYDRLNKNIDESIFETNETDSPVSGYPFDNWKFLVRYWLFNFILTMPLMSKNEERRNLEYIFHTPSITLCAYMRLVAFHHLITSNSEPLVPISGHSRLPQKTFFTEQSQIFPFISGHTGSFALTY